MMKRVDKGKLSFKELSQVIGKTLKRDLNSNEPILKEDLE